MEEKKDSIIFSCLVTAPSFSDPILIMERFKKRLYYLLTTTPMADEYYMWSRGTGPQSGDIGVQ